MLNSHYITIVIDKWAISTLVFWPSDLLSHTKAHNVKYED